MKSKIFFIVLLLILVVVVVIGGIFLNSKDKNLTLKMYDKMCNFENYKFGMQGVDVGYDFKLTIAKKENVSFSMDIVANQNHTSTLIKDGLGYYIDHTNKEYYEYEDENIDADILKSELSILDRLTYQTGKESIDGKDYYYEEYEDITTFIMFLNYEEESKIKTRFYFDKGNVVFIKNIIDEEQELLKVEFSDIVEEELFNIPEEYEKI